MKHLAEHLSIGREFVVYVCLERLGDLGTKNALLGTENVLGCFLYHTSLSIIALNSTQKLFYFQDFFFFFKLNIAL